MTRTLPLVFLLILFASGCGEAEHPREELIGSYRPAPVQVNIPDPNLRKAVERALGKAQGAPITDEEMATLADLSAVNSNIGDLTGLNFASSLTTLELDSNQIVDIAPLASLTRLRELWLFYNRILDDPGNPIIMDITPLAGLTQLTRLFLSHDQIADVTPLAGLTQLTELSLSVNQITDITPLAGLTQLEALYLSHNQIADVTPLAGLTQLGWLHLAHNQITDITPLAGLIQLRGLGLYHNQSLVDTSLLCVLLEINPALELSTDVVVRCQD